MMEKATRPAARPIPTPADLQQGEEGIRFLQQMLGLMHANKQGSTPEFQTIMGHYRKLTGNHQKVRKALQDHLNQQAQIAKASRKPAPGIAPGRTAAGPSALAAPRRLVPPPASKALDAPTPPATSAAPSPTDLPAEVEPTATAASTPVNPPEPLAALPEPLALPKFNGTLGPPGSKAIDEGPPVANLQRLLAALGYAVAETREYDSRTFRAVQQFQMRRRLAVTGLVGLETRRLFNEMVTG